MKKIFLILYFGLLATSLQAQNGSCKTLLNQLDSLIELDYSIAERFIDSLRNNITCKDSLNFQHNLYYKTAKMHAHEGIYSKAAKYFDLAIQYAMSVKETDRHIKYLLAYAHVDLNQGKLDLAIEKGLKASELALQINDSTWLARTYINIAESYRFHNHLDFAAEYNQKALAFAILLKDQDLIGMTYNNMAAILGEQGENQTAIDTLKNGLKLMSVDNNFAKAKFNSNLGFCYRNMGIFEEAMRHHKLALSFKRKAKMHVTLGYTYGAIGRAFQGLKFYDSAVYYTLKEYDHAKKYNDPYQLKDASMHVSSAYYELGDYKNAVKYLLEGDELEDSLYNAEIEQKSILYQRKYDLSQKENEIDRLKIEKTLEISEKKYLRIGLISALLVFVLIAIIFYLRNNKRAQAKQIVEMQLAQVKQENEQNKLALSNYTKELMLKNQRLMSLDQEVDAKEAELSEMRMSKAEELNQLGEMKLLTDQDWVKFKKLFDKAYPKFFDRLNGAQISFTKGEKRLMALVKLNMENNELAETLGISTESVAKAKFRLKKKLNENNNPSIEDFVHHT